MKAHGRIKPSLLRGGSCLNKWLKRPHIVTIRVRWVIVGLLLLNAYGHSGGKIIYADPLSPAPQIAKLDLKPLKPLPDTPLQPVEAVEAIAVAQPAPVATPAVSAAPGGCVSGYFTGNFYEDYIIRYESGGNSCATNYLGCFGLMQACPGYPLRDICGGDPACQLDWFWANKVANDPKYGSWAAVYSHEIAYGWW